MCEAQGHTIIIRAIGSGYAVSIEPPIDGEDLDGTFDAHKNARGWASGLRMTRRWPIVDLASNATLHDTQNGGGK
jgi:hypothetical protein